MMNGTLFAFLERNEMEEKIRSGSDRPVCAVAPSWSHTTVTFSFFLCLSVSLFSVLGGLSTRHHC
jgi:hypothetical protein